jgi:hypothetical protein
LIEDAPRCDYSPGMGGNDPNAVFSSRLSGAIEAARESDAAFWMIAAKKTIARHTPAFAVAA